MDDILVYHQERADKKADTGKVDSTVVCTPGTSLPSPASVVVLTGCPREGPGSDVDVQLTVKLGKGIHF